MSHEIRTPMNGVLGMARLLQDTPLSEEQADFCHTIVQSAEALLGIINDILDFSKVEAGKVDLDLHEFDLSACVASAIDLVAAKAAERRLNLAFIVEPDVPSEVRGDSLRLRQVLLNLLNNAIKFTASGDVFLSVERAASEAEAQGAISLRFAVTDTGPGIPPDRLNRLFHAFSQVDASTTRRHGGTGLGLAISKKLVTLMGGDIGVQSVEGSGSTFAFTVPLELAKTPSSAQAASILQDTRALLVDDNAINQRILQTQLRAWGVEAVVAQSANEALAILSSAAPFSFAILDFQMPETDGIGLAKAIRAKPDLRSLPLILFTSMVPLPMLHKNRLAGLEVADVLTKPVKPLALRNALLKLVTGDKAAADNSPTPDKRQATLLADACPLDILLVDDNVINRKLGRKVLERLGYAIEMAEDGRLAVAACAARRFDVVLMDIEMPELNGEEACRTIRTAVGPVSPFIVALTANAIVGDRERYLASGFDGYLSKPLNVEELRAQLVLVHKTRMT